MIDRGATDAPGDAADPDASVDAPVGLPDAGVDFPVFEAGPDLGASDATPSPGTALYALGLVEDQLGLRTVATDGTGSPRPLSGFNGLIDFEVLGHSGLAEAIAVSTDRPRVVGEEPVAAIALPNGLGRLLYYHRKTIGTSGLLLVRPDGGVEIAVEVPGLYREVIADPIGLSDDGVLGAAVARGRQLHLFRTDGQPLSNGSTTAELAIPAQIDELVAASLTFAGQWLYVVGIEGDKRRLFRAPVDGSADPTALALPDSGGQPPSYISDDLTASADGQYLALRAGVGPSVNDIYTVSATAEARNITGAPAAHAARGAVFGQESARLALSATGSWVAFVKREGSDELFVAPADGSDSPVQVTGPTQFFDDVSRVVNLLFVGDQDLLFMAGTDSAGLDVYRLQLPGGQLSNVTAAGSTIKPFDGQGDFTPNTAWVHDRWLYYLAETIGGGIRELRAIDLQSFAPRTIYDQGWAVDRRGAVVACGPQVLLVVQPDPQRAREEIWGFDQDLASAAVRLAAVPTSSGDWRINGLTFNGCGRAFWSAGGNRDLSVLWSQSLDPPGAAAPLTYIPRHFAEGIRLTTDGATAVYASGGSEGKDNLRAVPLPVGQAVSLDPAAGFVEVLAVY